MKHKKLFFRSIVGILSLSAVLFTVALLRSPEEIRILYPFDNTLFPPEIISPTFWWEDSAPVSHWTINILLPDTEKPLVFKADSPAWAADDETWKEIKARTSGRNAEVRITGCRTILGFDIPRSEGVITIQTSVDEVGAPIFYRDVPLPFEYALKHMDEIKWRLGDISSKGEQRVVLENMPVCGNCHSFSADGSLFGMDVDYANDKGSYVIGDFSEEIMLTKDKVISWSDYQREEDIMTYGLLSRVSPDGRYTVSTVRDRSVFVPVDDLYFSQLFFPLKGILAYYDINTGTFDSLPGADDTTYVQSNPAWSPDGNYVVFARNTSAHLKKEKGTYQITQELCDKYIAREKLFCFDLYRIPFNDGKGGTAVPLKGASQNGKSNYFPKYSPDGKWIVFCQAESFMLLQPDSKLHIMPAEGGQPREMNCNTYRMNSWHSWSPNSKWIVFSSKAFTPYTQFFLTHIDENGNDSPPVLLSQFNAPDRAANIPEFVNVRQDYACSMHEMFADDFSYYRAGTEKLDSFGDYDLAEKDFLKALEINPDNVKVLKKLGEIYFNKKKIAQAEQKFKKVLALKPDDAFSHYHLGKIYQMQNNESKAEKKYLTAIKYDPENYFSYHDLGYLYLKKKDFQKAEKAFTSLLRIARKHKKENPDCLTCASEKEYHVRTHANLGTLYLIRKEFTKAEMAFRKVIEIEPKEYKGYMSLGQVYLSERKYEDAITNLEKALALNPGNKQLQALTQKLKQRGI